MHVRILSGDIDGAIALLTRYFPSVLSPEDEIAEAETLPSPKSKSCLRYLPSATIDPRHLALILRIQSFIEDARTVPLPDCSPPVRHAALTRSSSTRSRSVVPGDEMIQRIRSLHAEAHRLPKPEDRMLYITEVTNVCGLLAHSVPETCKDEKILPYLSYERRVSIADQIDGAILCKTLTNTA